MSEPVDLRTNESGEPAHTAIFGLKGTGKSNYLQTALDGEKRELVYDMNHEHDALNRYIPTNTRGDKGVEEFETVAERMVLNVPEDRRPRVFAVEEASRVAPPRRALTPNLGELVDRNRHYNVGLVVLARRPAQVNSDLVELADRLVVFRLTGANDYRRLEEEVEGLGDAVRELDDYHYVLVHADRSFEVRSPVDEASTTGNL